MDADAEGDDDPTQTFVIVDGVDPTVTDAWRALEAPTGPPATLALSFPEGGSLAPPEEKTPLGDSPSNPLGVNRTIQFGASSIYEYDADTPIGGPLEDSPTPVVIPSPRGLGRGAFPRRQPFKRPAGPAAKTRRPDPRGAVTLWTACRWWRPVRGPPAQTLVAFPEGNSTR